jgi:molybdopterin/thiamine biosynthesis adenylyltransferase
METLTNIRRMSRTELEAFRNEVNAPVGAVSIPYVVFAALASTNLTLLPLSSGVFPLLLKALYQVKSLGMAFTIYGTSRWLDNDYIKGYCMYSRDGHDIVYFLTTEEMAFLLPLESCTVTQFEDAIVEYLSARTEAIEPTEIELRDPVFNSLYLKPNSEAANVDERTSRFNGATWFEEIQKKTVILAGLGGIGSYVCFLLARVQPTAMLLYDDDVVESANMSGQLYGLNDVGRNKVDAISDMVMAYANYNKTFAISEKYKKDSDVADIMICGFDNMEARKLYFGKWVNHVADQSAERRTHCLFIDGRLSAEYLQVYCITGDDMEAMHNYKDKALFNDSEADETVCSYKQTTYMANMIGSIIVNLFTNFVANEVAGAPIRELPFLTTYDGNSMELKIS